VGAGRGIRVLSAPAGGELSVCPHCWNVNPRAERLCGRCGADMAMALQESGGLRRTAPVQSPVPVRVAGRLSILQRIVIAGILALLGLAQLVAAFGPRPAGPKVEQAGVE
jgi:hypothetical protein